MYTVCICQVHVYIHAYHVCVYIFHVNMVFRVNTNNHWPRWLLTYSTLISNTLICDTLIYDLDIHHYNIHHSSYHFHMYHINIYITTTIVVVRICIPSERKKERTHFQKAVVSPKDFRSFFLSRPLYTYALSQTYRLLLPNYCAQYGVATNSRLLKIIGLFCKRALSKRLCSAQETLRA